MTAPAVPGRVASPTLHATIIFSILVFLAIIVLSFLFRVEVVARGEGRVVPISRVQVVQPEFSGRITAIHVRNGMTVREGDVLIELDPTEASAELRKIEAEQDRLAIEAERIAALWVALGGALGPDLMDRGRKAFVLPDTLNDHPFAVEQRLLIETELEDLLASIAQIDARAEANLKSEAVTSASIDRVSAALDIQSERLRTAEQLLEQGATSRSAFLGVQQVFTELERQRDVYLAERNQKVAERLALDSERRRIVADKRNTLQDRRAQIEARLATLAEEERTAARRLGASRLLAPTSGVVDRLAVFTIGGVAKAGEELLRVVPTDIAVEIEANFPNEDIGFIEAGQHANIRLHAYPSERFGFLKGTVTDISADSIETKDGQWQFVVRIAPEEPHLSSGDDRFHLMPGMTATVDVTTDTRRIISYFFAPILRTLEDALGER